MTRKIAILFCLGLMISQAIYSSSIEKMGAFIQLHRSLEIFTLPQAVENHIKHLKTLFLNPGQNLSPTEQGEIDTIEKLYNKHKEDMRVSVVATLLKDIREKTKLPLDNAHMQKLRKRAILLFEEAFNPRDNKFGGLQALDLALYEFIDRYQYPVFYIREYRALISPRLQKVKTSWKLCIDPKGAIATHFQRYIIEKLAQDKTLFESIQEAIQEICHSNVIMS